MVYGTSGAGPCRAADESSAAKHARRVYISVIASCTPPGRLWFSHHRGGFGSHTRRTDGALSKSRPVRSVSNGDFPFCNSLSGDLRAVAASPPPGPRSLDEATAHHLASGSRLPVEAQEVACLRIMPVGVAAIVALRGVVEGLEVERSVLPSHQRLVHERGAPADPSGSRLPRNRDEEGTVHPPTYRRAVQDSRGYGPPGCGGRGGPPPLHGRGPLPPCFGSGAHPADRVAGEYASSLPTAHADAVPAPRPEAGAAAEACPPPVENAGWAPRLPSSIILEIEGAPEHRRIGLVEGDYVGKCRTALSPAASAGGCSAGAPGARAP